MKDDDDNNDNDVDYTGDDDDDDDDDYNLEKKWRLSWTFRAHKQKAKYKNCKLHFIFKD